MQLYIKRISQILRVLSSYVYRSKAGNSQRCLGLANTLLLIFFDSQCELGYIVRRLSLTGPYFDIRIQVCHFGILLLAALRCLIRCRIIAIVQHSQVASID